MNPSIRALYELAEKPQKHIIGLMSGTSLDGLDIALCRLEGQGEHTKVDLLKFETCDYSKDVKQRLKVISSKPQVSLEEVCLMHTWLGQFHGKLIAEALQSWEIQKEEIDCIASHGQTIYHAPRIQHKQADIPNTTLQIGDADHLATTTGILTISDFRQKHTSAGGEGAPMVSLADRILFTHEEENRVLLNIGGIANFTWLPSKKNTSEKSVTTDTGTGNTLIDAAMQHYFSEDFDVDSKKARSGNVNKELLDLLKKHEYFEKGFPKTTGPEVFNLRWINRVLSESGLSVGNPEDLIATLTRFSAETIADAILEVPAITKKAVIYVSGGGIHNPQLMDWIGELLPEFTIQNFNKIGFDPDAKEAVLFAVLANETLSGKGFPVDTENGLKKNVNFGKISFPV